MIPLAQAIRSCISRIPPDRVLVLITYICLGTVAAHAQNATWLLNPGTGDWNTAANCTPATVPTGTATFGASNTTTITISSTTVVGTLQFNAGAPAYTFNVSAILLVNGTGTLILSGANTYRGATNVELGTLQAGSTTALSANSAFSVTALLDLHGFNNTIGSLSGTGIVTNNGASPATLSAGGSNSNTTFAGTLTDGSDSLGFAKGGLGVTILIGGNTYTGGTTINAGTLQIGDSGTSGSIAGNVTDNATFAFNRSDSVTFSGVISGTGALVQMGPGTLTLTGDNSYGGGTTINTGASLQLGTMAAQPAASLAMWLTTVRSYSTAQTV